MIRINLLGGAKPRRGKRAAPVAGVEGGGSSMMGVIVVLVLLAIGANGFYWYKLKTDGEKLARDLNAAKIENRHLAEIKAKYLELEKQKDSYERRVSVIHQLQQNQSGPANLLTLIGDTVNVTDAVWLNNMKEDGNNINLEGVALSVNAVANLMQNLRKTGHFRSVEIKETFQDDTVKDLQAFVFTLVCEKQPQAQKT